jgi:hypothetical protein
MRLRGRTSTQALQPHTRRMAHVSIVGQAFFGNNAAAVGCALDMVVLVSSIDNGEHAVPSAYHHQPAEPSLMMCICHEWTMGAIYGNGFPGASVGIIHWRFCAIHYSVPRIKVDALRVVDVRWTG